MLLVSFWRGGIPKLLIFNNFAFHKVFFGRNVLRALIFLRFCGFSVFLGWNLRQIMHRYIFLQSVRVKLSD